MALDGVANTVLNADPCRPFSEPLQGSLDCLQHLHAQCVLRITVLKSVSGYLLWMRCIVPTPANTCRSPHQDLRI